MAFISKYLLKASNRTLSAMTTENYGTTTNTTDTNISSEKSATFVIIIVSSAAGICLVFILICASVLCKCRRKKWKPQKEIQENTNDLWISVPFSEELISDSNELTSRQNHDIDKSQETECGDYSEISEKVTTRVNDRPLSETDVLSKTRKSRCHPKRVTFFNDDTDYISMKDGKVYIQDAHLRFAYVNDRLSAWGSCGELRKSIMTNASGSYINMNTLMQRSLSDLSIALKQPNIIPEQKFLHKSTTKSKS